jgi:xanthine dehydrogenase accessory factor
VAAAQASGIDVAQLANVRAPLGLDIGADSPAQFAVNVMAEILIVMRGRTGGSLRQRSMSLNSSACLRSGTPMMTGLIDGSAGMLLAGAKAGQLFNV